MTLKNYIMPVSIEFNIMTLNYRQSCTNLMKINSNAEIDMNGKRFQFSFKAI